MKLANITIADKESYYPNIDGLRGIAILMVLGIHTSLYLGKHNGDLFWNVLCAGNRGVQLFFLVSAFTLFNSSYRRYKKDNYPVLSFYVRRFFRIMPYWWIMVVVFAISSGKNLGQIIPSILFYFGVIRYDQYYEVIPQGWSLFVEEVFYLLLPLIFSKIKNIKSSIVLLILCLIINKLWIMFAESNPIIPRTNSYVEMFPLTWWYCFAGGILIYFIHNNYLKDNLGKHVNKLYLLDILAFMLLKYFFGDTIIAVCIMSLIFLLSMHDNSMWSKLTRIPIIMRFGGYCYSIYLFHTILLTRMEPIKNSIFDSLAITNMPIYYKFAVYFPIITVISMIFGYISFNYIEKPFVKVGKLLIVKLNGLSNRAYSQSSEVV